MIEAVEIEAPGQVVLRGEARAAGDAWIVLVHALGSDLDRWNPLVEVLDDSLSVLAADLRGHGGSDGIRDNARAGDDVAAMLAYARGRGAEVLVAVGAGDVAAAVLETAERFEANAVVLLGPTGDLGGVGTVPRFVVAAAEDPEQVAAADLLQRAAGWSLIANVPTAEKGTELLTGSWGTNVRAYVTSFLRDVLLHHAATVSQ